MGTPSESLDRRAALQRMSAAAIAAGGVTLWPSQKATRAQQPNAATKRPHDRRLGPLQDLNGYFPFQPSDTPEQWRDRAEEVRRRILVAAGRWPEPELAPLTPVVHGKVDRPEYTVEKVYFESSPGLYVTGNLYRPKEVQHPLPGILCPHGHWSNGRFHEHSAEDMEKELATGGEVHEICGKYPLQARCVQLARMGCLVFHYDMLGYADSVPITQALAHGFAEQRPHMSSPDHWGLFSAQSELRLLNALGLQLHNSIGALDWLLSLPEVDPDRVGVTGASGGGTQTFLLTAVDERVRAAFPAVMVSTAMQGGCTCENASYLRVGTGNIEFAAMAAPRPLGMTAANDWTQELETKGLPELRQHYELLGVPDLVTGKWFDFGHNYNLVSRGMMYRFFNEHFGLGWEEPVTEAEFTPLTKEEMSVWNAEHPRPASDEAAEIGVLQGFEQAWNDQRQRLVPHDRATWPRFREVYGGALDVMIGRSLPAASEVEFDKTSETVRGAYREFQGYLRHIPAEEELPVTFLQPNDWNRRVVLFVTEEGQQSLWEQEGKPRALISRLLKHGHAVAAADLFMQGEFLANGAPPEEIRRVENKREFLGYTTGYNPPLFAQRVHDILTLLAFIKYHDPRPEEIQLIGWKGPAAAWAATARALVPDVVQRLAAHTAGFRWADTTRIWDPHLLPGAVKYGDLPGFLALGAPQPLWLAGEGWQPDDLLASAYRSLGAMDVLHLEEDAPSGESLESGLIDWLAG